MKRRVPGRIVVVCGPPGSGKTTYCKQHARDLDIIWDLDEIAACLNPHYSLNSNRNIRLNKILGQWRDLLLDSSRRGMITNNIYVILSDEDHAKSVVESIPRASLVTLKERT